MKNNDVYEATIEIIKNSSAKYQLDKKTNRIVLDRFLFGSQVYPGDYGFIDHTLELDGDPIDVFIHCNRSTFPGCIANIRVVGVLEMIDDHEVDNKIICVYDDDPLFKDIKNLDQINQHLKNKIWNFFENYKILEGKKTVIKCWSSKERALKIIKECQNRYLNLGH